MFDIKRIVTVTRADLPGEMETKKHLNFLPAHKSCLLKHNRLYGDDESNSTTVKLNKQIYTLSTLLPDYSFYSETISSFSKQSCSTAALIYNNKPEITQFFFSSYLFETGKYFSGCEIYFNSRRVNYVFDTKNNVQQEMECEEMEMSMMETEIDIRKPEIDAWTTEIDMPGMEMDSSVLEIDMTEAEMTLRGLEIDTREMEKDITGLEIECLKPEIDRIKSEIDYSGENRRIKHG